MYKKFLAAAVLASATAAIVVPVSAEAEQTLTKSALTESYKSISWNTWSNTPFSLDGQMIATGFGLAPSYDYEYEYATFYVKDFEATTFEGVIGVHEGNRSGDRGTSTLNIYADNVLIYSKNYTNKTTAEQVKAAIPAGTSELTFKVSTDKGAHGGHSIVVGNPTLTNVLPATTAPKQTTLVSIGKSDSNYYYSNFWSSTSTFKLGDKLVNRGIGLYPSYDYETAHAEFNIGDYSYTTLETTIGVDANVASGDRGNTTVSIYADGMPIYTKNMTNATQPEDIQVAIPNNTQWLMIRTAHDKGAHGGQHVILDNPRLTNAFEATPEIKGQLLTYLKRVDSSSNYSYVQHWSTTSAFADNNGIPATNSIGLYNTYRDEPAQATYYIGDYNYSIFDATFALDKKWLNGDYGTTQVTVFADNKSISSFKLDAKSPRKTVAPKIPAGTKSVTVQALTKSGSAGRHRVVALHPILRNGFTDIPTSHAYFDEINYLVDKGIINGYSDQSFKPSNTLTRGHAAMLVARALNLTDASSMRFNDVDKAYDGYGEIAAVVNAGFFDDIITGNRFEQRKPLTRGEMADIVAKAFDLTASSSKVFRDTNAYWAKDSIAALYDNNVTVGYEDNTFRPNNTLTRGHFSLFIARAMNEAFR